MPKITARDIVNTASDLKRYENYANRNMQKSTIQQVSEKVEIARTAMREANEEFLETDVSTFTPDNSDMERQLANYEFRLERMKENIKKSKERLKNDDFGEDSREEVEEALERKKEYKREYKAEIKDLKILLKN